jgi:mRNA interferase MazF
MPTPHNTHQPRRGEVWLAQLDKVRPLIILTRDPLAGMLNAVIAAPITSRIRGVATEVSVGLADGVRQESVANLDTVQLVARARLIRRVGRARAPTMAAICTALSTATACHDSW